MTETVDIAVFAKAPLPGYAKTRLIPALGARGAARLQRALLRQAVRTALSAGLGKVTLWCAPDARHPAFRALHAVFGLQCRPQVQGDLGERMAHAFTQQGAQPLLLIGSDCPALTAGHLRACADALRSGNDAVLLPAEDGGYVLIGLRRAQPSVFADIRWGSCCVLEQTRERLRQAGLCWHQGEPLWDVDRPEDLGRLDEEMRHARP